MKAREKKKKRTAERGAVGEEKRQARNLLKNQQAKRRNAVEKGRAAVEL